MRRAAIAVLSLACSIACGGLIDGGDVDDEDELAHLELVGRDSFPVLPGQRVERVTVRAGRTGTALAGEEVHWRVVEGGGTLADSVTLTDVLGQAQVTWTVGSNGRQCIEAHADLVGTVDTTTITAIVGRLVIVAGDSQRLSADAPASVTFQVRWLDDTGQASAFQYIHWKTNLAGLVLPLQTFTDPQGYSSNTLSHPAGTFGQAGRVTAYLFDNPVDSVTFALLADHRLRLVSGGNQIGAVNTTLPAPIEVSFDNPANGEPGPPAAFKWEVVSGGGRVLNDIVPWNRTTPMHNNWTLGNSVGAQSLRIVRADAASSDTLLVFANATASGASGCGGVGTLHQAGLTLTSETWRAVASPHVVRGQVQFGPAASLTIEPGVVVCLESNAGLFLEHTLHAVGTPATPIRFTAADTAQPWGNITLAGTTGAISEISNARMEHAYTAIVAGAPVRIDSTIIRQSRNFAILIDNTFTTNRVIHTTVDTTRSLSNPAVMIGAAGTVFAASVRGSAGPSAVYVNKVDVTLQECVISGNVNAGVFVAGVMRTRIGSCNLLGNGGLAVSASGAVAVDARSNWWGDPAGPAIGGTNGISSSVDASVPRLGQIDVGYRPTW